MSKLYKKPENLKSLRDIAAMQIILSPVVTEKSTRLAEVGQYVFRVATDANKFEIGAAIEKLFEVQVLSVNTVNVLGKTKRFRGRIGFRSDFKKAIVTLKGGQTIDLSARV